jgi:hypothetical protein
MMPGMLQTPCQLLCVEPSRLHEIWPCVEPLVRRAVERSISTDLTTVATKLVKRQALMWLVWDGEHIRAAVVTSISASNGHKRCVIVACAGEGIKDWLPLIGQIEDYARAEGCVSTAIIGRRAWQRRLQDYRPVAVTLEKKL